MRLEGLGLSRIPADGFILPLCSAWGKTAEDTAGPDDSNIRRKRLARRLPKLQVTPS
jgi:hypothetical protein